MKMNRMLLLTAALIAGLGGGVSAQEMRVMQAPPTLERDDPREAVVRGLSTPLVSGDVSAAEAYLLEHASASYDRSQAQSQLRDMLETLREGYEVATLREGPDGAVLVPLRKKGEQDPVYILVVGMEAAAPHRITSLRLAEAVIRTGDD